MISSWYIELKRRLTRLGVLPLRLWIILLIVNFTVLILPLGSIFFFRIYENQLISETEAELIAQSVFIAEIYKHQIRRQLPAGAHYGHVVKNPPPEASKVYYTPLVSQLDLATDTIYPSRPDAILPVLTADDQGAKAGIALSQILLEAQRTTLAGIRVLDFSGSVIAGRNELGLSLAHVKEVQQGLQGQYVAVIRQRISDEPPPSIASISRGTGIRIFTVYPIISGDRLWGAVYLSRTPRSIIKHIYAEKNKVMLAALSILTLTLFIVLVTSWTIARPVYRLIERTKKISRGEVEALAPLEVPGTREMALLTRSFSDMARSLQQRSSYIKNFATHVSHELKTPLTSIRGAAELLDDHFDEMSQKERQKFLGNILDDTERLKNLVSRLLELAQADSFTPRADNSDLVKGLAELASRVEGEDFSITLPSQSRLVVNMSSEVVEIILMNMIENARQHGASALKLALQQKDEMVELSIEDDGSGISSANARKIFDPFFTTKRDKGGTGIGLGIVKSLLENHKGSIRLEDCQKGARFVLVFPAHNVKAGDP